MGVGVGVFQLCGMVSELVALHKRGHCPTVVDADRTHFAVPAAAMLRIAARVDQARHESEDSREVTVWENQRRYLFGVGFKSTLLPTERSNWSSRDGKKLAPPTKMVPSRGSQWADGSNWQIDHTVGDSAGWEYSSEFGGRLSKWSAHHEKRIHFVRRRRWFRLECKKP
jgi:hypothetical protein